MKDDEKKSVDADDGQNVAIEVPEEKRRVSTTSVESSSSSPINSSKLLNRRKSQVGRVSSLRPSLTHSNSQFHIASFQDPALLRNTPSFRRSSTADVVDIDTAPNLSSLIGRTMASRTNIAAASNYSERPGTVFNHSNAFSYWDGLKNGA